MRRLTALAACLAVAAVPLAGCGNKQPGIGKRDASELTRLLRKVQAASDDPQRCNELAARVADVRAKIRALPSKVDADVRDSLRNGAKNLAESARAQCENAQTTPTATTPTETTPTETAPPTTQTVTPPPTTQTTPPPSTATTPPPTSPPPTAPGTGGTGPGTGNGNGQGNANGQGKGVGKKPKGKKHKKPKGPKANGKRGQAGADRRVPGRGGGER
jgi:predicted small secreted protein